MAKLKFNVACPVCQGTQEFTARKPSYHTPTITRFNCKTCRSRFLTSLAKSDEPGKIAVDLNVIEVSAKGVDMLTIRNNLKKLAAATEKPNEEVAAVQPNNT